jgi:hypothetical protein
MISFNNENLLLNHSLTQTMPKIVNEHFYVGQTNNLPSVPVAQFTEVFYDNERYALMEAGEWLQERRDAKQCTWTYKKDVSQSDVGKLEYTFIEGEDAIGKELGADFKARYSMCVAFYTTYRLVLVTDALWIDFCDFGISDKSYYMVGTRVVDTTASCVDQHMEKHAFRAGAPSKTIAYMEKRGPDHWKKCFLHSKSIIIDPVGFILAPPISIPPPFVTDQRGWVSSGEEDDD